MYINYTVCLNLLVPLVILSVNIYGPRYHSEVILVILPQFVDPLLEDGNIQWV